MNDTDRIAEIRQLADAATEGPWVYEPPEAIDGPAAGLHYVSTQHAQADDDPPLASFFDEPDARFVAASRQLVPELLDQLEQARTELAEARRDQAAAYNTAMNADEANDGLGAALVEARAERDRLNEVNGQLTAALVSAEDARVAWVKTAQQQLADGEASDGYHTHNELYEYRMLYNAHAARGWLAAGIPVVKSWKHHDGELCFGGGWFIVTAELPTGQVSNHYAAEHWPLFDVPEVELPPEYDGHTPAEAAERLRSALAVPDGN